MKNEFEKDEKRGSFIKDNLTHIIFIGVAVIIVIAIVVMVTKWNKGELSDYDPSEDTSEFDIETNDYIQPLSSTDLAGKENDGELTILTLGNSPFADGGDGNNLAEAIAAEYGANVINGGISGSYMAAESSDYSGSLDGISLSAIAGALSTGDFSTVLACAKTSSDETMTTVDKLSGVDMTKVDGIVIMYDLQDYISHRPAVNGVDSYDVTSSAGALNTSLKSLRSAYPYIRIVVMSTPACGQTIDGFYIDGESLDMGSGTLTDYMGHQISATATQGASFVDVYYGAITLDNRDDYLYDDYHINDEGAAVIASRLHKLVDFQD